MRRRGGAWAAVALAGVTLACGAIGCVATATAPPPRAVVVNGPPPPPVVESRGAPPGPNASWVPGYWHWAGARYVWIPGHWESAPPGSTWYAPRYVSADGSYYYEPGGWRGGAGPAAAPASGAIPPNARAMH